MVTPVFAISNQNMGCKEIPIFGEAKQDRHIEVEAGTRRSIIVKRKQFPSVLEVFRHYRYARVGAGERVCASAFWTSHERATRISG
jgi:hypothetical protein